MKKLILLLIPVFVLASCSKDGDSKKPQIDNLDIDSKTEEITVQAGQSFTINYTVSDNEGLSQIRADVHDAFDGHTHGKTSGFNKMYWEQIDTLNGLTEMTGSFIVNVPDSATAGPYHMDVIIIDLAGNQSDIGLLDFTIDNNYNAEITVSSHDFSNEIHVDKGDTIQLQGMVTDDVDLDEVVILIEEEGDGHTHGKTSSEEVFLTDYDLGGGNDVNYSINESIPVPSNVHTGHYKLEIVATDSDGNMTVYEGEFHFH